jgi:hypothetical protein
MVRKIIGTGTLAIAVAAAALSLLLLSANIASAQSSSGRSQGCFDSSGNHHNAGWCAKHMH